MMKEEYKKHLKEVFKCQYARLVVVTDTGELERSINQKPKPKDKEEQSKHHSQKGGRSNGSRIPS